MSFSKQAETIAREHLQASLPQRWRHVQAVAEKAKEIGLALFDEEEADLLLSTAWLHDIGYALDIKNTGFHPLDGAVWLRAQGFDERLVSLVAYHSCSALSFDERNVQAVLSLFTKEESLLADALLYADMTTGPNGETFTVHERMDEIVARYGATHEVSRFTEKARPFVAEAAARVLKRLSLR